MRSEIKIKAKEAWIKAWTKKPNRKTTGKLTRKSTKDMLKKFKKMTKLKSTVIVKASTGKIQLRDYLHRIGLELLLECPLGYSKQTVQHTLLKFPGFAKLKEEMWYEERETDLSRLLETFSFAARVSKFLLATSKLY